MRIYNNWVSSSRLRSIVYAQINCCVGNICTTVHFCKASEEEILLINCCTDLQFLQGKASGWNVSVRSVWSFIYLQEGSAEAYALFQNHPALQLYTSGSCKVRPQSSTVGLWSFLVQLEVKYLLQGQMNGSYLREGAYCFSFTFLDQVFFPSWAQQLLKQPPPIFNYTHVFSVLPFVRWLNNWSKVWDQLLPYNYTSTKLKVFQAVCKSMTL